MAKIWKIKRWEGSDPTTVGELPGHLTKSEIATVLQRLLCRGLTEDEILRASRRRRDKSYSPLLERVGRGSPISYGTNPHYTAEIDK